MKTTLVDLQTKPAFPALTALSSLAPASACLPISNALLGWRKEPSYRLLNDLALVELVRGGEKEAFGELIRRYKTKVKGLALRITKNEIDAQEVVQDTFLNAFAKLDSFKGTAAFASWLYRVAANGALMLLRGRRRDAFASWEETKEQEEAASLPSMVSNEWASQADRIFERKQIAETLQRELQAIPKRYRLILILREIDGLSNQEIAESLDLTVAAVKSRLHRARLTLRLRLSETWRPVGLAA